MSKYFRDSFRRLVAGCLAMIGLVLFASPILAQSASDQEAVAFRLLGIDFLADAPAALTIGAGAFNVFPNDDRGDASPQLRLEYRLGRKWRSLGPLVGAFANGKGGAFGYAGIYSDLRLGHWIATPAAGVGAYREGGGKDLGGVFQFHLGLGIAYPLDNGDRLGLKLSHVSNANIHDENPGVESLLLTYTLSLGRFGWADR